MKSTVAESARKGDLMTNYSEVIKNLTTVHGMPTTIRLAIEAIEKQMPKKPKTLTVEYYKTYTFECECGFKAKSNCTQSIEVRDLDYCPCCGQAIDWSGFYDD